MKLQRQFPFDAATLDESFRSSSLSVEDIVSYCRDIGYIGEDDFHQLGNFNRQDTSNLTMAARPAQHTVSPHSHKAFSAQQTPNIAVTKTTQRIGMDFSSTHTQPPRPSLADAAISFRSPAMYETPSATSTLALGSSPFSASISGANMTLSGPSPGDTRDMYRDFGERNDVLNFSITSLPHDHGTFPAHDHTTLPSHASDAHQLQGFDAFNIFDQDFLAHSILDPLGGDNFHASTLAVWAWIR